MTSYFNRIAVATCFLPILLGFGNWAWAQEELSDAEIEYFVFSEDEAFEVPSNRYVDVAMSQAGTIEFWAKPIFDDPDKPICVIANRDAGGNRVSVYLTETELIMDAADQRYRIPFEFENDPDQGYHIALVSDGNRKTRVYIDGKPIPKSFPAPFGDATKRPWFIGSTDGYKDRFYGEIGGIRIWNEQLSRKTIGAFINRGNSSIDEWLVRHDNSGDLIGYGFVNDEVENVEDFRYVHPLAGSWVPRNRKQRVKLIKFDAHGIYREPGVVYLIPLGDAYDHAFFIDGTRIGTFENNGNGTIALNSNGRRVTFRLEPKGRNDVSPRLICNGPDASVSNPMSREDYEHLFNLRPGEQLILERPQVVSQSTDNAISGSLKRDLQQGDTVKNYEYCYKGYNVRNMGRINFQKTGTSSDNFVFRKPGDNFNFETVGFIPPGLFLHKRNESSAVSTSSTMSSQSDISTELSTRTGWSNDTSVFIEGGFDSNQEVQNEFTKMEKNSSTKIVSTSVATQYALINELPLMQLDPKFKSEIYRISRNPTDQNFRSLFESWGTHYPYAITYGGMMVYEADISSKGFMNGYSNSTKDDTEYKWGVNSGGLLDKIGLNMKSNSSYKDGTTNGSRSNFEKNFETTNATLWVMGGDGSLQPNAAAEPESVSLDGNVVPAYLNLRPLHELISPQFFRDPKIFLDFKQRFRQAYREYLTGQLGSDSPQLPKKELPQPDIWELIVVDAHLKDASLKEVRQTVPRQLLMQMMCNEMPVGASIPAFVINGNTTFSGRNGSLSRSKSEEGQRHWTEPKGPPILYRTMFTTPKSANWNGELKLTSLQIMAPPIPVQGGGALPPLMFGGVQKIRPTAAGKKPDRQRFEYKSGDSELTIYYVYHKVEAFESDTDLNKLRGQLANINKPKPNLGPLDPVSVSLLQTQNKRIIQKIEGEGGVIVDSGRKVVEESERTPMDENRIEKKNPPRPVMLSGITGRYERKPVENGWHVGEIVATGENTYQWKNEGDAVWNLTLDLENIRLNKAPGSDYLDVPGGKALKLRKNGNQVIGFDHAADYFERVGDE